MPFSARVLSPPLARRARLEQEEATPPSLPLPLPRAALSLLLWPSGRHRRLRARPFSGALCACLPAPCLPQPLRPRPRRCRRAASAPSGLLLSQRKAQAQAQAPRPHWA